MRLDHIVGLAFDRLLARILRRTLIVVALAVCAVVAVYYFTAASFLTLEADYGAVHANLIIGAIYGGIVIIGFALIWATRNRPVSVDRTPVLARQREMQLVMLVEAVMLGYALARKANRAH